TMRGDYAARQQEIERLELERQAASRLAIPEPIVAAGLKHSTFPGRSGNGYVVSVTVPLPLFNHGQAEAERARATIGRVQAEQTAQRQQIESEVRAAHETLRLRREAAATYAQGLEQRRTELIRTAR